MRNDAAVLCQATSQPELPPRTREMKSSIPMAFWSLAIIERIITLAHFLDAKGPVGELH